MIITLHLHIEVLNSSLTCQLLIDPCDSIAMRGQFALTISFKCLLLSSLDLLNFISTTELSLSYENKEMKLWHTMKLTSIRKKNKQMNRTSKLEEFGHQCWTLKFMYIDCTNEFKFWLILFLMAFQILNLCIWIWIAYFIVNLLNISNLNCTAASPPGNAGL